jgi:hypothetical protein
MVARQWLTASLHWVSTHRTLLSGGRSKSSQNNAPEKPSQNGPGGASVPLSTALSTGPIASASALASGGSSTGADVSAPNDAQAPTVAVAVPTITITERTRKRTRKA